jgi:hypothetical protein
MGWRTGGFFGSTMKMNWYSLAKRHHLDLTPSARQLCTEAWALMAKSSDPLHNEDHLYNVFKDLNDWLLAEPSLKKRINWSVLLTAVCWHDTWKAQHFAQTPISVVWAQWYEGLGSVKLFRAFAKQKHIDEEFQRQVCYAIRKHSLIQFMSHQTLEAQLLWDLDALDLWDIRRTKILHKYVDKVTFLSPTLILRLAHWFLRLHTPHMIYHDWPYGEFTQRQKKYFSHYKI